MGNDGQVNEAAFQIIGDATLTYEEMATFLAQMEAILNSKLLQFSSQTIQPIWVRSRQGIF